LHGFADNPSVLPVTINELCLSILNIRPGFKICFSPLSPLCHFFQSFMPFRNRPNASIKWGFYVHAPLCKQRDHSSTHYRPIMAKASLKSQHSLDNRSKEKLQGLVPQPTLVEFVPFGAAKLHGDL